MNQYENYLLSMYPEVIDLKKSIDYLQNVDLINTTYEEIEKLVDNAFPIIAFGEGTLKSGKSIFRARQNFNNGFFVPYNEVQSLGMPPPNSTSFGRANIVNRPVFYGSSFGNLTLFESCQNLQLNEKFIPQNFTVAEWQVKENQNLRLVTLYNSDRYTSTREDIVRALANKKNLYDKNFTSDKIKIGEQLISQFFANQFAKSEIKSVNDYKYSAYFAEYIRKSNMRLPIKFDGLLYPSVAYKYKADNVAIFPESLYKIRAIKAYYITTYNFDFEKGTCASAALQEGRFFENGQIIWCESYQMPK